MVKLGIIKVEYFDYMTLGV